MAAVPEVVFPDKAWVPSPERLASPGMIRKKVLWDTESEIFFDFHPKT